MLADVAAASMADGLVLGLLWSASAAAAAVLARRAGSDHERVLAVAGLAGQAALAVAHALVSVPPGQVLDGAGPADSAQLAAAVVALALAARLLAPRLPEGAWGLEGAAVLLLAYLTTALAGDLALVLAFVGQALALDALARHDRRATPVVRHAAPVFLTAAGVAAMLTVAPPDAIMSGFSEPLAAAAALAAIALACVASPTEPRLPWCATRCWRAARSPCSISARAWRPGPRRRSRAASWRSAPCGRSPASPPWRTGLAIGRRALRIAGLGLLLVSAGKVFLVDLATLTEVYRVASFVAVGLLLLVAAVVWQRAAAPTTT